ncbi:hypothetical protein FPOAC1_005029 [Fusarium poae]|uniref:hypothetical protein n=1 Tax=Fusarium poae TaxID=36050 RepID=UPI001CE7A457|nr:hypothetical protein FPOAC1_005029 [Fusarium poae]KAG8671771.1 hypothetical protein FPOAC1_005029 [Fusarium poae]
MQMSLSEIDYDAEQLKGTCCEAKKSGGGRSADLNIKVEMQVSELMFSRVLLALLVHRATIKEWACIGWPTPAKIREAGNGPFHVSSLQRLRQFCWNLATRENTSDWGNLGRASFVNRQQRLRAQAMKTVYVTGARCIASK